MQVSKLQNASVRMKEQNALSEENMRSLNARELSAKDGDIRLLHERCADLATQVESQRTEAANKVCFSGLNCFVPEFRGQVLLHLYTETQLKQLLLKDSKLSFSSIESVNARVQSG